MINSDAVDRTRLINNKPMDRSDVCSPDALENSKSATTKSKKKDTNRRDLPTRFFKIVGFLFYASSVMKNAFEFSLLSEIRCGLGDC